MNSAINPAWAFFDGCVTQRLAEDGEAHVWEIVQSLEHAVHLAPEERERWLRMKDEETAGDHATSQGGIRRILSLYRNCPPAEILFRRRERGKPYVEGGPDFNISHTKGRIFAIITAGDVGIDVESSDRRVRVDELSSKFFFPEEQAGFENLPPEEKNALFLRYWVCKEATVKLSGDGIYHGLRDARVSFADGRPKGEYRGKEVWLWEFSPAPGFMAAVASWRELAVKCFFRI